MDGANQVEAKWSGRSGLFESRINLEEKRAMGSLPGLIKAFIVGRENSSDPPKMGK
jgi:hypothetical protein